MREETVNENAELYKRQTMEREERYERERVEREAHNARVRERGKSQAREALMSILAAIEKAANVSSLETKLDASFYDNGRGEAYKLTLCLWYPETDDE